MSTGFDQARLSRIDAMLQRDYLDSGIFPHASLMIARGGDVVHRFLSGEARPGEPVQEDTLFRIASMTKPVTSVVFMQLVEEGRISLDDPVAKILPEWADLRVQTGGGGQFPFRTRPAARPMLMLDLLRHTSGLTYSFQELGYVDAAYRRTGLERFQGGDLESFVRTLSTLPLEYDPGGGWIYSVATDALGAVIQRIEGKPLDAIFAERIFDPLAMVDTHFQVPVAKIDRLADCHVVGPHGRKIHDPGADSAWTRPPKLLSGGGGLVSTVQDYHRFCRMLLNGGALEGARILSPLTLRLMTSNHLPGGVDLAGCARGMFSESENAGVGFGLGFAVVEDPAKTLTPCNRGEFYWGGIFTTSFNIDPVSRTILIFMTQLMPSNATRVRRALRTMTYAAMTAD